MKRLSIAIVIGLSILALSGCAFTQANLNVRYAEENAKKGPLSSVRPLSVEVGEFIDKRPETDKIGYKRNGFGQKTANIVTTKPVPQIVREAILIEFLKNGHLTGGPDNNVVLSGTITSFWFDCQINFWTVEFMGTVSVDLNVIDGKTGATLLMHTYQGHYNEKSMGGLAGTWERVMNTALERMIQQMSTDNKLIQVLKSL
jgi:curli biogenesis system outer membrane secretion channel CsgG